jgi:hypothetical protein
MLWLLATRPRRIVFALVLAEIGVFFAIALRDPTALAFWCLAGAVVVGVPLTKRWQRAEVQRRAAALADELAAGGQHEAAARLRWASRPH